MNYPNMSYCMCENTLQALQQVITAMDHEGQDFLQDLSREERQAFEALYRACQDFVSLSDQQEYESDDGPLSDDQIEQVKQSVRG